MSTRVDVGQSAGVQERPVTSLRRRTTTYGEIVMALPVELRDKLVFNREVYGRSFALRKWATRYGPVVLERRELRFINFLGSRTLDFGKLAEMITKDQFMRGVWQGKTLICAPLGMTPRDLYRTVRGLEEKGLIYVRPVQRNGKSMPTIYEIAIDFIVSLLPSEDVMSKLRQPRLKTAAPVSAEIIDFDTIFQAKREKLGGIKQSHLQVVSNHTSNIIKGKPEDNKEFEPAVSNENEPVKRIRKPPRPVRELDCNSRIREALDIAATLSTVTRRGRAETAEHGRRVSLTDLNACWKQAMVSAFGTCSITGLTGVQYGMFKRIVKTHTLDCSWLTFFSWVVSNWDQINQASKEYSDYRRRKTGEWSIASEDVIFLGSPTPDLYTTVRNLGKLIKRYSQQQLQGAMPSAASEEVDRLKGQLEASRREVHVKTELLARALQHRLDTPPQKPKPPTHIEFVDPATDSFFTDDTDLLPEWS